MERRLVVGLFRSSGIAEDARNRLRAKGVPTTEIAVTVLMPAAPVLPTATAELEALSVDQLIFGNVRETFAKFIRNRETVVSVRAVTDEEVEFAAETLRQYSPIAVELVPRPKLHRHRPTAAAMRNDCQGDRSIGCSRIEHNRSLQVLRRGTGSPPKLFILRVLTLIEGGQHAERHGHNGP